MAKKPLSAAQRAALEKGRAKRDANRQNQNLPENQNDSHQTKKYFINASEPQGQTPATQLITLTPEQLSELVNRLTTGSNVTSDKAPAPSMTAGVGMQTNHLGQIVGTHKPFELDLSYYPNPIEELYNDFDHGKRTRRLGLRENYFLTWDITTKPYENKFGISIQEPFFHATLYMNQYDDEGEEIDRAIVVQTLHFNEDEQVAYDYVNENGWDLDDLGMRKIMDMARYERVKQWLIDIFFPPRNFELSIDAREEAIGGSVVKVVTKSNVKGFGNPTPKIDDEELS